MEPILGALEDKCGCRKTDMTVEGDNEENKTRDFQNLGEFPAFMGCGHGRNQIRPRGFMTTSQTPPAKLIDKNNIPLLLASYKPSAWPRDSHQSGF